MNLHLCKYLMYRILTGFFFFAFRIYELFFNFIFFQVVSSAGSNQLPKEMWWLCMPAMFLLEYLCNRCTKLQAQVCGTRDAH